ncbi:hypothetical protein Pla175_40160 [Pirellulimonas nuda]|uniref:DUF1598 domain-containing protein n=1 Tax=Pirellulimonas nuda TaxID=2528009 RepID=A0A518DGK4_9BACT|nr:DUF1598 domain-containing protein [Pirellulimonas nuda]QDU90607.1 hypothetical protein Pla175_40160 [Pirellulimonas nuda]
MRTLRSPNWSVRCLTLLLVTALATTCSAQFGGGGGLGGGGGGGGLGGGGGGLGGGGGGLGGGGGTGATGGGSGVIVDVDGVLRRVVVNDPTGQLARQRVQQALSRLEGDLAKPSAMRKVSLTRLEKAVAAKIDAASGPDNAMKHLAGLTRIDYVFCYPETGDIVIAGPAEPWGESPDGRMRGVETGRPVIELQDLAVALRAFPAEGRGNNPTIYCSIDPTPEGLARMQGFLRQFGRQAVPGDTQFIVHQLQESLGPQVISIGGVSPRTHFAQVIVEADYRMKLIGIGLEQPPVRMVSYVEKANPAAVARNAMQRWYFVPDYECVRASGDGLACELVGEGVKLIGEDELVQQDGTRRAVGSSNRASQTFVDGFTKLYPKLAERAPIWAQLRNCIDLAVTAALIQKNDYYAKTGWNGGVLAEESAYKVETYNAPQQVASAVNSIWKGRTLMTPIGGGVQIDAAQALNKENLLSDEDGAVYAKRETLGAPPAEGWWWD